MIKCKSRSVLSILLSYSERFNKAYYTSLRQDENQIDNFLSPDGSYVFRQLLVVLEL